jgi:hypothetical protein
MNARVMRGKIHSSHGGRKAYLNFELKDHRPPEAARLWRVLDFKVQIRSGRPSDEWDRVAGAALNFPCGGEAGPSILNPERREGEIPFAQDEGSCPVQVFVDRIDTRACRIAISKFFMQSFWLRRVEFLLPLSQGPYIQNDKADLERCQ